MIFKKILCVFILFIIVIPTGCSSEKDSSDKLLVYASFYAMYDFTLTVAGDKADVKLLMPPGAGPHDWEPTAKDIASLEKAGLLIYNGHNMEHFIDSVKDSVKNKDLLFIETGISVDSTECDPHIWLDPMNAKKQYEAIKNALCEKDPENRDYYETNYQVAADELDKLDEDYRLAAEEFTKKDLVVSHAAYGYMCSAYGLNQLGISGIYSDEEPSLSRMTEIVEFIKKNNVTTIFNDELSSSKIVDTIAAEVGDVAIEFLSTFESDSSDYITVMYKNLAKLKEALK